MDQFLNLLFGKLRATAVLSIFCLTTLLAENAFATNYYVALPPTGSDAPGRTGSEDQPFATIGRAAAIAKTGDVVYVLPGTYRETAEIKQNGAKFTPRDGKGTVTINGADLMLNWTPVAGSTYKTPMSWNLDTEEVAGRKLGSNQVFQDGKMIDLVRWPKRNSEDLILMPDNGKLDSAYIVGNDMVLIDNDFASSGEPAARWVGAKIWYNLAHNGYDGQGKTAIVVAIDGNQITIRKTGPNGLGNIGNTVWGVGKDTEYFLFDPSPAGVAGGIENPTQAQVEAGINALLKPGQWWKYGTGTTGTLYVKTTSGQAPASVASATSNLIESKRRHFAFWPEANGNAHSGYTIEDFNLFACAITTDRDFGSGIVEKANSITLSGLTVKYVSHQTVMHGDWQSEHYGWTGIILSGRNNTLRDCDIMYSATSAITFTGANNKLLNNQIHETNYMASNSAAVNTGYHGGPCLDSEIAYNTIWNTTMMGVNLRNFKNSNPDVKHVARIHHNTIYDFMIRSYDSSALDVVGEDLRWVRIDHNRIYNTRPEAKIGDRKYGIYLDYGGGPNSLNRVRATVDHNVVWDVTNPMTLNTAWDAHIFNNVFLTTIVEDDDDGEPGVPGSGQTGIDAERPASLSINLRLGEAPKAGTNILIYNNILGDSISHGNPGYGYAPKEATESILNNITNARGEVLSQLFVNATSPMVPGQPSTRNYQLKATATAAIDKGIKVDEYTSNYPLDRPVVGLTDIGAFEHPTSPIGTDTQAPSVPVATNFVVADLTGNGFTLSWTASTDNVGVAYYEVYSNGALYKKTNDPTITLKKLEGSTTYFMQVVAVDASGNRSALSTAREVKTLAPVVDTDIVKTSVAPVIDGTKEATWTSPMLPIDKRAGGTAPDNAADFSGEWTSLWDDSNLYIFMDVNDNVKRVDDPNPNGVEWYFDDHIEILVDPNFTRSGGPVQYFMVRGKLFYKKIWNNGAIGEAVTGSAASLVEKADGSGYRVEVKIPFTSLGITPQPLSFIGIDVQIGDDDDGGNEDTRLSWITTDPSASGNSAVLGIAKLTAPGLGDDTEKPSAPTAVTAGAISPTSFTVNWTASTDNFGVANYEVFVNGNLVGTPRATTFTVERLTEGTTYSVQVRAKDRYNNLSDLSSLIRVTTPTWGSAVKYESELASFAPNGIVDTSVPGYSGTGYVRGITYDNGSPEKQITYTVNVPAAGTYTAFQRYTAGGRMSLYVNGEKKGNVEMPRAPAGFWESEVSVMSLALQAGNNTVKLMYDNDGNNNGAPLLDYLGLFLPGADSQAPTVPTGLTASNTTSSGFTLSWNASTDNSGVAPGYQIYQNGTLVGTSTSTTFNVTGLAPGTYVMMVRAVDAAGSQSDASRAIEVDVVGNGGTAQDRTDPVGSGRITARGDYAGNRVDAFDNNVNTAWIDVRTASWIQFAFDGTARYAVSSYSITANRSSGHFHAKDWKLYGTNVPNGTFPGAYVELDSQSNVSFRLSEKKTFTIRNTTEYRAYRLEITANSGGGAIQIAEIELFTPGSNAGVPVRGVTVTPASVSFTTPGATQQLEATIAPVNATNKTLVWHSSNTAVATVSSTGLVTSVGEGTATITVTTNDGGKTATSSVTVTRVWTKIDNAEVNRGITFDANWNSWSGPHGYYRGTMHGTRDVSQLPEVTFSFTGTKVRYYGGIRWDFGMAQIFLDGALVSTVDMFSYSEANDRMLYESGDLAYGAHTLKIKATNTKNPASTGTTVFVDAFDYTTYGCGSCRMANAEVASRQQTEGFTLKLHPNPASREVTLDLSGFEGESAVQVKMSDMTGKLHLGQQVKMEEGRKQLTLPVGHLPQGLFFVTVQGSKVARTAKMVITK